VDELPVGPWELRDPDEQCLRAALLAVGDQRAELDQVVGPVDGSRERLNGTASLGVQEHRGLGVQVHRGKHTSVGAR